MQSVNSRVLHYQSYLLLLVLQYRKQKTHMNNTLMWVLVELLVIRQHQ